MSANVVKAIVHLILLLIFSLVILWILFFLHVTGINSLLIPDRLSWHNGFESRYIGLWYTLNYVISYVELLGLLWLVRRFNLWYGKEWLKPSQMNVAKVATVLVGVTTAICVEAFYIAYSTNS